ncbi:MAG: restriction endonuclease subunit S [Lutibacter sp.]|nr:restriction endonuclease subunit S [Lutibacter sp.]
MEKVKNIPALRFPEFNGEWGTNKLSNLLEFKNGINASKELYGSGYKFINVLDILNNDFITHDSIIGSVNVNKEMVAKFPVSYGDILFQRSSETREEVGTACVYLDKYNTATFGGFVIRGRKIGEYDPVFLNKLLKTDIARDEITSRSGGSTRFNVGQETLSSIHLNFPTLPEQQKIATFLTAVDEKLQALKQKKNLLEQYKKGVMQQIFSQELRFKDDNGNDFPDWEEKKLGEVLSKNSNKNKRQKYLLVQSVSNKFGFINQDEMFEDRRVASKDTSNYYVIEKGHFAYNPSRIDVGSLAYKFDDEISVISPLYISFRAKDKFLKDDFLLNWFSSEQFLMKMNNSFEGSVRNTLSYVSLVKMEISIPTRHEQTKIANFLSAIDEKINHCQAQITNTEVWKKGLLQQLFI